MGLLILEYCFIEGGEKKKVNEVKTQRGAFSDQLTETCPFQVFSRTDGTNRLSQGGTGVWNIRLANCD